MGNANSGRYSVTLPFLVDTYRTAAAHDPGWTYSLTSRGYGKLWIGRHPDSQLWFAHRYAWVLAHGSIPDGLLVLHTCDTPACFWIKHLWLGTYADNTADMLKKGRARGPDVNGRMRSPDGRFLPAL